MAEGVEFAPPIPIFLHIGPVFPAAPGHSLSRAGAALFQIPPIKLDIPFVGGIVNP
jgi:hypothetical protein